MKASTKSFKKTVGPTLAALFMLVSPKAFSKSTRDLVIDALEKTTGTPSQVGQGTFNGIKTDLDFVQDSGVKKSTVSQATTEEIVAAIKKNVGETFAVVAERTSYSEVIVVLPKPLPGKSDPTHVARIVKDGYVVSVFSLPNGSRFFSGSFAGPILEQLSKKPSSSPFDRLLSGSSHSSTVTNAYELNFGRVQIRGALYDYAGDIQDVKRLVVTDFANERYRSLDPSEERAFQSEPGNSQILPNSENMKTTDESQGSIWRRGDSTLFMRLSAIDSVPKIPTNSTSQKHTEVFVHEYRESRK